MIIIFHSRTRRLGDFEQIYSKLKAHLVPKTQAKINPRQMAKYIGLHKKSNRNLIKKILDQVQYIPFDQFKASVYSQIKRFNEHIRVNKIKSYVFCLGVGSDDGGSSVDYNIYKSNLWVFLLGYHLLKVKPYDIMLNLKDAIRMYWNSHGITDYLLVDDCTYSGSQVVEQVIYSASAELMNWNKDSFLINSITKKPMFHPIQSKVLTVHYVIPYLSKIGFDKLKLLELETQIHVEIYTDYICNPLGKLLDKESLDAVNKLYKQFISWVDVGNLIPIFFAHKIADSISTIELILIKGQVLDNPKKRLVFVDACVYNPTDPEKYDLNPAQEDFNQMKVYCPNPPYLAWKKILGI